MKNLENMTGTELEKAYINLTLENDELSRQHTLLVGQLKSLWAEREAFGYAGTDEERREALLEQERGLDEQIKAVGRSMFANNERKFRLRLLAAAKDGKHE